MRLCRSAYDVLMRSGFLSFVSEIDIHSMASNESSARQRKDLDEKLTSLDGQLHVLKSDQERTYQLYLRQGAAATFVSEKLGELAVKIAEVETQIVHRSEQRQALAEQIDAALGYVAKTRYPHRNRVYILAVGQGLPREGDRVAHVGHGDGIGRQDRQLDPTAGRGQMTYSITSSASEISLSVTASPSALAIFALIASSNFVGCATGRSAAFAPRRILSTYSAARRYISVKLAP